MVLDALAAAAEAETVGVYRETRKRVTWPDRVWGRKRGGFVVNAGLPGNGRR